LVVTLESTVA